MPPPVPCLSSYIASHYIIFHYMYRTYFFYYRHDFNDFSRIVKKADILYMYKHIFICFTESILLEVKTKNNNKRNRNQTSTVWLRESVSHLHNHDLTIISQSQGDRLTFMYHSYITRVSSIKIKYRSNLLKLHLKHQT